MKTQCPHCKTISNVPDEYQGREAKCLKCKKTFIIDRYVPKKAQPAAGSFSSASAKTHRTTPAAWSAAAAAADTSSSQSSRHDSTNYVSDVRLSFIPQKMKQYISADEKILFASCPSTGALILSLVPFCLLFLFSLWMNLKASVNCFL